MTHGHGMEEKGECGKDDDGIGLDWRLLVGKGGGEGVWMNWRR